MNKQYTISYLNLDILDAELKNSGLVNKYLSCTSTRSGNNFDLSVSFNSSLDNQESDECDSIVSAHQNFPNTFDFAFLSSRNTQEQNIAFGQSLLHDWMRRNTLEGMSVVQSLWVFSRFETFEVNFGIGLRRVDLFKMFYAGAIPTVYMCMLQVQPDPMTESYHWLTQERLDWVKNKVEAHLGSGMVSYLQSVHNQIMGE